MKLSNPLPDGLLEANEKLVRLTPAAAKKISQLIDREKEGDYLRIKITGGGCNGLSYKIKFAPIYKPGDLFVRSEEIKIVGRFKNGLVFEGDNFGLF